jgi:hypothetical protein
VSLLLFLYQPKDGSPTLSPRRQPPQATDVSPQDLALDDVTAHLLHHALSVPQEEETLQDLLTSGICDVGEDDVRRRALRKKSLSCSELGRHFTEEDERDLAVWLVSGSFNFFT